MIMDAHPPIADVHFLCHLPSGVSQPSFLLPIAGCELDTKEATILSNPGRPIRVHSDDYEASWRPVPSQLQSAQITDMSKSGHSRSLGSFMCPLCSSVRFFSVAHKSKSSLPSDLLY